MLAQVSSQLTTMDWVAIAALAQGVINLFFLIPMRNSRTEAKAYADQLIELKLQSVRDQLQSINNRLLAGDGHLKRLDDRDHHLEVAVLKAINELDAKVSREISSLRNAVLTKEDLDFLRPEGRRNG